MTHLPTHEFDQLLVTGASWLMLGCAGWSMAICAAAMLESVSRGRLPATTWVGCPPSVRRILLAGLGILLAGAPGTATAHSTGSRAPDGPGVTPTTRQPTLPSPARPLGSGHGVWSPVVVRPGDTLWHLADLRLDSPAPGPVAHLVADVHRRNRVVIGPDPDLIRPGQRLSLPADPDKSLSRAAPTPRGEP